MTGRDGQITKALVEVLSEWDCDPDEAKNLLRDAIYEYRDDYEARAEAAYNRQQEALMESGGPDDSAYRRDMKNAGRGHLLR